MEEKSGQEAIDYCETLTFNTYDDWRLPNINELKSEIDNTNPIGLVTVWSSSSVSGNESYAWAINLINGSVFWKEKNTNNNNGLILCVRGG